MIIKPDMKIRYGDSKPLKILLREPDENPLGVAIADGYWGLIRFDGIGGKYFLNDKELEKWKEEHGLKPGRDYDGDGSQSLLDALVGLTGQATSIDASRAYIRSVSHSQFEPSNPAETGRDDAEDEEDALKQPGITKTVIYAVLYR